MKDIAIYGAGGLGKEIAWVIYKINEIEPVWNLIGFFDDGKNIGQETSCYGKKILGGINELNLWNDELSIVLAFGVPHTRSYIHNKIINPYISFPNIIYPDFWVADPSSLSMGMGNIIGGGSVFSCEISIGNFNLFNSFVYLGHDVMIGSYNIFMPSVRISGEVVIGHENLFGVSSIVIQQKRVGNNVTLSPGSVLLSKPRDNSLYIGNPAKLFKY